jgi:hypothetical protein
MLRRVACESLPRRRGAAPGAEADGKTGWKGHQDKGHQPCVSAFRQALASTSELPTEDTLAAMRTTIRAAEGLGQHG